MNRRSFSTLLVLCILHLNFVAAAERLDKLRVIENPAAVGMDSQQLGKIASRMEEFVRAKQAAGVVTLIARRGTVVHLQAVGTADLASGRKMTPSSMFAIASMTKPITAAAVMILVDEGKLNLDNPVSKYIPEFKATRLKGGTQPAREITIRDCLRHTSGLVSDQRNVGSLADTAQMLAKSQLVFEPGSKWQYGPGLSVAGRVVEVASGQPFDTFLQERIFQPLGMHETTFHPTAEQLARLAKLYQPSPDKRDLVPGSHWILDATTGKPSPNPSGGLFSTATDLVRFYQMNLNGGELNGRRILSAKSVKEMTSLQSGELETGFTPGCGWGLGFCLVRKPQGPTKTLSVGSFGHGGAFGTQGWIDPQRELICIMLVQRAGFGNGDASELRSELQRLATSALK